MSSVVSRSAAAGSLLALGYMLGVAGRIVYTITSGKRWYQFRKL